MMRLIFILIITPCIALAQTHYPGGVEAALKEAGSNRVELEKTIAYYQNEKNELKLKAAYFLIENIGVHYSSSYYWVDKNNKRIEFNELAYPSFNASIQAFEVLRKKYQNIHPQPYTYKDIDSIKASLLIANINRAFEAWKKPWAKTLSFNDFCEYILPYRISIEPLQNWRSEYQKRFAWINDSSKHKTVEEALHFFTRDYNKWFFNTYKIEKRNEPLPRLGALQLLLRKKGPCEDIADLEVFTLRSQGIPASIDEVPVWATSSGKHFLNVAFTPQMKPVSFDVSTPSITGEKLAREPAKVIRTTYSKQKNTLASLVPLKDIPEGFLRTTTYIDVTKEYWQTKDVNSKLFAIANNPQIAYACVFNFLDWRPAWWGKVNNGNVVFKDMCKGAVFLPMYYVNGKMQPAGYPVASGYNNTLVLQPDLANTREVHVTEQAGYVVFRPGKKYRFYYWDNKWKLLIEKTATSGLKEMVFTNVPKNALLLLVPHDTQHKERPFIVLDTGQRVWL